MDIMSLLNSPLLGMISMLVPQAAPVINFIQSHRDVIAKAAPVVQAAIDEGKPAFDAALQHAPQLATALKGFLQQHELPGSPAGTPASQAVLNKATSALVGKPPSQDASAKGSG